MRDRSPVLSTRLPLPLRSAATSTVSAASDASPPERICDCESSSNDHGRSLAKSRSQTLVGDALPPDPGCCLGRISVRHRPVAARVLRVAEAGTAGQPPSPTWQELQRNPGDHGVIGGARFQVPLDAARSGQRRAAAPHRERGPPRAMRDERCVATAGSPHPGCRARRRAWPSGRLAAASSPSGSGRRGSAP